MIRQRVHLRRIGVGEIVLRLLVSVLALAVIFYGAIVILAALKVDPHTLDSISAYRTIEHRLISITARNITGRDRIIVAVAGVLCLIGFGSAAWRALPRPYLARTDVDLERIAGPGRTEVAPRAIERVAEIMAAEHPAIGDASARFDTGTVDVRVELTDSRDPLGSLRDVQTRVGDALERDGLPRGVVDVTLAGLTPAPKET